jgi:hypothetical protein
MPDRPRAAFSIAADTWSTNLDIGSPCQDVDGLLIPTPVLFALNNYTLLCLFGNARAHSLPSWMTGAPGGRDA